MVSDKDAEIYKSTIMHDPFFRELTREEYKKLIESAAIREISSGEFLLRQGDIGTSMFVILSGTFSVLIKDNDSISHQVASISTSEIVGELALLTEEHRTASILAVTDGKVLEISRCSFHDIVSSNQKVIKHLFRKSLHRIKGNFSGWFAKQGAEQMVPSAWRQTFIVILAVFPVVIIYNSFFSSFLKGHNEILVTFISCVITISFASWPIIPACMNIFDWWLFPEQEMSTCRILRDIVIMLIIFSGEVLLFLILYEYFK